MGTSLNGLTPAGTYPGLIKTGDNAPIDGTLKTLSDGNGNNLPMEASTTAVNFTNQLQQGGVAVPTASQVNAKQDTLVSGTNIKTINGTSLLGSGNIPVVTSPSGVAGAIQFSNGSAFASDAANLFWDDTNNRLGVGTNSPTATAHIVGANTSSSSSALRVLNSVGQGILSVANDGYTQIGDFTGQGYGSYLAFLRPSGSTRATIFNQGNQNLSIQNFNGNVTFQNTPITIVGSGSTSATTSLLVQNSAGTNMLNVRDDGNIGIFTGRIFDGVNTEKAFYFDGNTIVASNYQSVSLRVYDGTAYASGLEVVGAGAESRVGIGTTSPNASAKLQLDSTTKGFLPPRGTNTQMSAIASPATGLVFYDTTNNKLCVYNGTSWIPLH